MPTSIFRLFVTLCLALLATSASALDAGDRIGRPQAALASAQTMSPALENWVAPPFYSTTSGVFSSIGTFTTGAATSTKADTAQIPATFVPLAPCRLVDTRGPPRVAVYLDGGPYSQGETRTYTAVGNACGIPAGNFRVIGVSLAVTTVPNGASGDVTVASTYNPAVSTVLMTAQAGLWNSATTVSGVTSTGTFQVHISGAGFTGVNMAVDINGYYTQVDPANTGDYFAIQGNYNGDRGLLSVTETGTIGAAIRGVGGGGTDVRLAQGANAIDVASGGLRVRGAGVNTDTLAFVHQTTAGNICTATNKTRIDNLQTASAAADLSGLLLFVQQNGATTAKPVSVRYETGTCQGGDAKNAWYLYSDGSAFAVGEKYNILVISP